MSSKRFEYPARKLVVGEMRRQRVERYGGCLGPEHGARAPVCHFQGPYFDGSPIHRAAAWSADAGAPRATIALPTSWRNSSQGCSLTTRGGFQQLAKREFDATSGQRIDLGTIKIVPPRTGEAGTLGMGTDITDGALVVSSVKSGGPAEGAGVRIGDKLVAINGITVADLTPEIAQTLISSGTVGVGQSFLLGVDRAGTAAQIKVVAVAW